MAGGGTEQARMRHLVAHVDHLEDSRKPLPPLAAKGRRRGSFNHEFLLLVGQYADSQPGAAEALRQWLRRQETEGHCVAGGAIETLSASHGQLNEAAAGVGLLLAVDRRARELVVLLRRWWWSEIALCSACEVPGATDLKWRRDTITVWAPGWRAMRGPELAASNGCRDLAYRLVRGYDVPRRPKIIGAKYNLAFRALLLLPPEELRWLMPPEHWAPPLPYPFHARRDRDEAFAWFDAPEHPDIALSTGCPADGERWVARENRVNAESFPAGQYEHIDYPAVGRGQ